MLNQTGEPHALESVGKSEMVEVVEKEADGAAGVWTYNTCQWH